METYVKEPLKVRDELEEEIRKEEDRITAGPLEMEFAAFTGSYLKEIALALGYSDMDQLEVAIDDIKVKMVKKSRPRHGVVRSDGTMDEAEVERVLKPVLCRYLGVIHLNDEKKAPYVKVGDQVKKGQVLARVETMNITNQVKAEKNGTLAEIMIKDGSPVEYGQILFFIEVE